MQVNTFHECIINIRSCIEIYIQSAERRSSNSLSWVIKNALLFGNPEKDAAKKYYLAKDVINTLDKLQIDYEKLFNHSDELSACELHDQLIYGFTRIRACIEEALRQESDINGWHNTSGALAAELETCRTHFRLSWKKTKIELWGGERGEKLEFWREGGVIDPSSPSFRFEWVGAKKDEIFKFWDEELKRKEHLLGEKIMPVERKTQMQKNSPPLYRESASAPHLDLEPLIKPDEKNTITIKY